MTIDAPFAFLSYCRDDLEFARQLADDLRRAGASVWMDKRDIPAGQRWDRAVQDALQTCPRMLVLLSPESVSSENVMDEVSFALDNKKTIIPVVYRECQIPYRLLRLQNIDLTRDYDDGLQQLVRSLSAAAGTESPAASAGAAIKREYGQHAPDVPTDPPARLPLPPDWMPPDGFEVMKTIAITAHSRIEEVAVRGERFVLKRSRAHLIDVEALRELVGRQVRASFRGTQLSIVTPLEVWTDNNEVRELLPYIEGVSLHDVVERNRYGVKGSYLGVIFDCAVRALDQFHSRGLVHRDVSPGNMMFTTGGDIVLLDVSFVGRVGAAQTPVQDVSFSAPETAKGKAVRQSDWHSLAATMFFLANRIAPAACDAEMLQNGIANIELGAFYRRNPEAHEMLYALLSDNIEDRPARLAEIRLRTGTVAAHEDILAVLDVDGYGFLILSPTGITLGSRVRVSEELRHILNEGAIPDSGLKEDVAAFLGGRNPWLSD